MLDRGLPWLVWKPTGKERVDECAGAAPGMEMCFREMTPTSIASLVGSASPVTPQVSQLVLLVATASITMARKCLSALVVSQGNT